MKLVVGLGNPGRRYEETRHNVGFRVMAEVAARHGSESPRSKFEGEVVEIRVGSEAVLLLTPHTFMNRSGRSVRAACDFYKLELADTLIVCDDFQLPLGRLRARSRGSSGGQKGLEDVIRCLGSSQVPRLRIGIGSPPPQWDVADYVLSKFRKDEGDTAAESLQRAADAVVVWVRQGMEACMNEFNREVPLEP